MSESYKKSVKRPLPKGERASERTNVLQPNAAAVHENFFRKELHIYLRLSWISWKQLASLLASLLAYHEQELILKLYWIGLLIYKLISISPVPPCPCCCRDRFEWCISRQASVEGLALLAQRLSRALSQFGSILLKWVEFLRLERGFWAEGFILQKN